jgi:hypothetical protein
MLRRLRLGLMAGLAYGALLSIVVLGQWIVLRRLPGDFNVWQVVALYMIAFPLAGVVVMLLQPLLWRSAPGAAVLGAIALVPVYCGAGLLVGGESATGMLAIGVPLACLVGGTVGVRWWRGDVGGEAR